ncbi:MAG: aconitate hydratase AcnA [Pseudorhodobacter sp.]|nr:aconitate hydratase AcnA [Pseudorhodobacter sp.]
MTICANPQFLRPLPGTDLSHLSLAAAEPEVGPLSTLPRSLKVLAEDILWRLPLDEARAEIAALRGERPDRQISFAPGRALLQDFLGVALMTDLASIRDAIASEGGNPRRLDPVIPVDFVVDHSLVVQYSASSAALSLNRQDEMERNRERFAFIKWCQTAFGNFRVIPPGRGIMHQVNLEWLSRVVRVQDGTARPDTMIGTDSHTTMVNALGVLGWGVGGIEAEAAMLGLPLEFSPPRVVGVRLRGALRPGATATDLVLHVTEMLRGLGVVGAFVEFHGEGVARLPLADRATIANMSPEYGATCTFFPVDEATLDYLRITGRDDAHLAYIEAYAKAQGLWEDGQPVFAADHVFDLAVVEPSMAGPERPEQRVPLAQVPRSFRERMRRLGIEGETGRGDGHGAVAIAAITSCTNTANPALMMTAGLLARNAVMRGLKPAPWVKTSLAPGSRVVTDYLDAAGLTPHLEALGFHTIGYGCTTCNGNSGPLLPDLAGRIEGEGLATVAVLSGNRNFEGRIHPAIKAAYLASPPLVIAAALAGNAGVDLACEPLAHDPEGAPVFLRDLWPDPAEVAELVARHVTATLFRKSYAAGMETTEDWQALPAPGGNRFPWNPDSLFIQPSAFAVLPPAFCRTGRLQGLRPLLSLKDGITTDHISPNAAIQPDSPAGRWLTSRGTPPMKLGNYGLRRGNPEVCARGMFDNPLLENEFLDGQRGNLARLGTEIASVWDIAQRHAGTGTGLVILAGRNYGAGSSRDWAAKGLRMLGVIAVLAESFERIHRSNLIGMGVLPLVFVEGTSRHDLALSGDETLAIGFPEGGLAPGALLEVDVEGRRLPLRLDAHSQAEVALLCEGGLLPMIRKRFLAVADAVV